MGEARYEMRVCQGNYIARQVSVTVVASSALEARRKALLFASHVHNPIVQIDKVTEIAAAPAPAGRDGEGTGRG